MTKAGTRHGFARRVGRAEAGPYASPSPFLSDARPMTGITDNLGIDKAILTQSTGL